MLIQEKAQVTVELTVKKKEMWAENKKNEASKANGDEMEVEKSAKAKKDEMQVEDENEEEEDENENEEDIGDEEEEEEIEGEGEEIEDDQDPDRFIGDGGEDEEGNEEDENEEDNEDEEGGDEEAEDDHGEDEEDEEGGYSDDDEGAIPEVINFLSHILYFHSLKTIITINIVNLDLLIYWTYLKESTQCSLLLSREIIKVLLICYYNMDMISVMPFK